jgi:hypothetical protein
MYFEINNTSIYYTTINLRYSFLMEKEVSLVEIRPSAGDTDTKQGLFDFDFEACPIVCDNSVTVMRMAWLKKIEYFCGVIFP